MELIKNIAAVIGCISACIGLLVTIFKPLRQAIINAFANKSEYQTLISDVKEIKEALNATIVKQDEAIERLDRVEKNVLLNESDRLKSELARYAAMCRRGEPIYEADYLHIQEVYEKYHITLHCNHTGTDNFNTIKEYFEKQFLSNNTK